jgi:hypothetical protein
MLFLCLIGGDAIFGTQIERLIQYWSKLDRIKKKDAALEFDYKNNKSILFSRDFYIVLILIYVLFIGFYGITYLFSTSSFSSPMEYIFYIIIATKGIILLSWAYFFSKLERK